ncbi:MAG: response regulator transcription factor [Ruminococcaceae bacterium]|nr:response regulator transcription factor [Oscillospiraceae bacterium]
MYNILVCDDEADIVSALKIYLGAEGYRVFEASNGAEALGVLDREDIHLVLMDIMMPFMDGITALSKLREKNNIPVILLTAKSEDSDKIFGLDVGADDYITKPFNPVEVLARVRSQLRRYMRLGGNVNTEQNGVISLGGIEINERSRTVTVDGDPVSLTVTEYDILKLLMSYPGEVMSSKEIYKRIRNDEPIGVENTVAVHIRHIREKIEIDPAEPRHLKVVWAQGYKFEA